MIKKQQSPTYESGGKRWKVNFVSMYRCTHTIFGKMNNQTNVSFKLIWRKFSNINQIDNYENNKFRMMNRNVFCVKNINRHHHHRRYYNRNHDVCTHTQHTMNCSMYFCHASISIHLHEHEWEKNIPENSYCKKIFLQKQSQQKQKS